MAQTLLFARFKTFKALKAKREGGILVMSFPERSSSSNFRAHLSAGLMPDRKQLVWPRLTLVRSGSWKMEVMSASPKGLWLRSREMMLIIMGNQEGMACGNERKNVGGWTQKEKKEIKGDLEVVFAEIEELQQWEVLKGLLVQIGDLIG